jgi:hypothetical protein
LVSVNGQTKVNPMIEELSNRSISDLQLRFSRKAAEAAPGIWEAEVERYAHEGWGMELREIVRAGNAPGTGILRIETVHPEGAIDRWNTNSSGRRSQWAIEPGDMIVGVNPEVGHNPIVKKLKESHRVRLTLLRWNAGPAPDSQAADPSKLCFEVTLRKEVGCDKLGVRLNPSDLDPTRTIVAEVMSGGLVERYNKSQASSNRVREVRVGDEVESINGERDHTLFAKTVQADQLVVRLVRRGVSAQEQVLAAAHVEPVAQAVLQPSMTPSTKAPAATVPASPPPPDAKAPAPAAAPIASPSVSEPLPASPSLPRIPSVAATACTPAAATETPQAAPSPTNGQSVADQKVKKENFLLKAELEQLKQERNKLLMDNERLRAQTASFSAEAERLERREKLLAVSADTASEVEALRASSQAQQAQQREIEERLQAALRSNAEASDANTRLESENQRLNTQVAQLNAKLDESSRRGSPPAPVDPSEVEALRASNRAQQAQQRETDERLQAALRSGAEASDASTRLESENRRLNSEVAQLNAKLKEAASKSSRLVSPPGAGNSIEASSLELAEAQPECLRDGLSRLMELSASLEHVLSCNPELSP